ncbi:hypothetical protein pdam_00002690 [Pocillopora damicornis]|uniref:Hint domain-containing protein n=1 Tax=Pocillopora damicornis TaxID=46731 RepID=A0A3M6U2W9_POCDA|nr:protein hedgehog-like [Pocillopora damicornis]RMX48033.1 hypothetical protein pdam_00002690 [Pocillopora damicornis]
MNGNQMNSYNCLNVLFLIHLVPWNAAAQNISTTRPSTSSLGLVITPLPWPHGTEDVTTIASGTMGNSTQAQENLTTTTAPSTSNHSSSWTTPPVGCYRDSYVKPRPLPELIANFRGTIDRKDVNKTVMACAEKARERGFKVFGIQFYTECWSGPGGEKTFGRDGSSVDCEDGVGKSGANFVYRFGDYELSSRPIRVQPRRLCFPAISQVTMESGASIPMSHLKVGDKVQTLGTNGESKFSEVITFLHKEIDAEAQFYNLKTKTGNSIKLSAHHLIFRKETNTSFISAVFASEIKMGDLLILNGSGPIFDTVTQITHMTMKGVYAPLTRQGTLFVDGVLVSCYAHWPSHDAAHLVMAPIRTADLLNRAWKKLTSLIVWLPEWPGKDSLKGVHWYPSILMSLTNTLII